MRVEIGSSGNQAVRAWSTNAQFGSASSPSVCSVSKKQPYWLWLTDAKLRVGRGFVPGTGTMLDVACALDGPPQVFVGFTARTHDVEFFDVMVTDGSQPSVRIDCRACVF